MFCMNKDKFTEWGLEPANSRSMCWHTTNWAVCPIMQSPYFVNLFVQGADQKPVNIKLGRFLRLPGWFYPVPNWEPDPRVHFFSGTIFLELPKLSQHVYCYNSLRSHQSLRYKLEIMHQFFFFKLANCTGKLAKCFLLKFDEKECELTEVMIHDLSFTETLFDLNKLQLHSRTNLPENEMKYINDHRSWCQTGKKKCIKFSFVLHGMAGQPAFWAFMGVGKCKLFQQVRFAVAPCENLFWKVFWKELVVDN